MTIYGEVVRLEPAHGFGFIHDDHHGEWFFVSSSVRAGGLEALWIGERVGFSQERTPSGPRAADIHHESAE
jgi:cold shock CspA family protein